MAQLACQLKSLHATHIAGDLNHVADSLSLKTLSEGSESQTVQLIMSQCSQAQIDLFASPESTYCLLWYSHTRTSCLTAGPRAYKHALPPVSLIAKTLCKVREYREQILFVAPYWPNKTWFSELVLLASAYSWRIPQSGPPSGTHAQISGTSMSGPWTLLHWPINTRMSRAWQLCSPIKFSQWC